MGCNGVCLICPNPCYRGEISGNQEKISPISLEEEEGASMAFDNPSAVIVQTADETPETENKTGLAVVENIGTYEVKRSIFGKEKVRRVK